MYVYTHTTIHGGACHENEDNQWRGWSLGPASIEVIRMTLQFSHPVFPSCLLSKIDLFPLLHYPMVGVNQHYSTAGSKEQVQRSTRTGKWEGNGRKSQLGEEAQTLPIKVEVWYSILSLVYIQPGEEEHYSNLTTLN